jgi:hypothetical protein
MRVKPAADQTAVVCARRAMAVGLQPPPAKPVRRLGFLAPWPSNRLQRTIHLAIRFQAGLSSRPAPSAWPLTMNQTMPVPGPTVGNGLGSIAVALAVALLWAVRRRYYRGDLGVSVMKKLLLATVCVVALTVGAQAKPVQLGKLDNAWIIEYDSELFAGACIATFEYNHFKLKFSFLTAYPTGLHPVWMTPA